MGQDPFGGDFKGPTTPYGQKADTDIARRGLHAIDELLQGLAGPVGPVLRSVEGQGKTLYNTSLPMFGQYDTKPNSAHSVMGLPSSGVLGGLARTFNPFYGTFLKSRATPTSTIPGPQLKLTQPSGGPKGLSGPGFKLHKVGK
jgi:hypothetical protein